MRNTIKNGKHAAHNSIPEHITRMHTNRTEDVSIAGSEQWAQIVCLRVCNNLSFIPEREEWLQSNTPARNSDHKPLAGQMQTPSHGFVKTTFTQTYQHTNISHSSTLSYFPFDAPTHMRPQMKLCGQCVVVCTTMLSLSGYHKQYGNY